MFLNQIVNIFTFTSSIISIITITLVIYLFCRHKHIRTIVASLILHKAKEVEAKSSSKIDNSECSTLAYIGIALTLLGMVIVILLHYRRSKFCRGHRFSNVVTIVLFTSDLQLYIQIKLCKTSGSPHLFKIEGILKPDDIRLNPNYLWDMLEINWDKIKLSHNSYEIELLQIIKIKMRDKIRVRRMVSKETAKFSHNDKTRNNMVQLRNRNRKSINFQILYFRNGMPSFNLSAIFLHRFFRCKLPSRSSRRRGEDYFNAGDAHY